MCLRFLDAKLSRLSQVLDKPCSPRDRSAVAVHAYSSFLRHWVMTFRERVSQGNSQSQARNSVCALAAIVYVIPDALRRSCIWRRLENGVSAKGWLNANMVVNDRITTEKKRNCDKHILFIALDSEWVNSRERVPLCWLLWATREGGPGAALWFGIRCVLGKSARRHCCWLHHWA